jgi:hypothetical protein
MTLSGNVDPIPISLDCTDLDTLEIRWQGQGGIIDGDQQVQPPVLRDAE